MLWHVSDNNHVSAGIFQNGVVDGDLVQSFLENITSLEMQGCSITLLKLDEEMVKLWDAPVFTPVLRWGV